MDEMTWQKKVVIGGVGGVCLGLIKLAQANFYLNNANDRMGGYLTALAFMVLAAAYTAFLNEKEPQKLFTQALLAPSLMIALLQSPAGASQAGVRADAAATPANLDAQIKQLQKLTAPGASKSGTGGSPSGFLHRLGLVSVAWAQEGQPGPNAVPRPPVPAPAASADGGATVQPVRPGPGVPAVPPTPSPPPGAAATPGVAPQAAATPIATVPTVTVLRRVDIVGPSVLNGVLKSFGRGFEQKRFLVVVGKVTTPEAARTFTSSLGAIPGLNGVTELVKPENSNDVLITIGGLLESSKAATVQDGLKRLGPLAIKAPQQQLDRANLAALLILSQSKVIEARTLFEDKK